MMRGSDDETLVSILRSDERPLALILAHQSHPFERPASRMGGQRAYQFAKWLPEFGWDAVVLCCPDGSNVDCTFPTDHSAVVGVPAAPASLVSATWTRMAARSGWVKLPRAALTAILIPSGDWSRDWRTTVMAEASRLLDEVPGHRPVVLVGEHSPDAGLRAAAAIARTRDLPWIADFRDPFDAGYRGLTRVLMRRSFRSVVSTASATVNVTEEWAEDDGALFGVESNLIRNGFDPDDIEPDSEPDGGRFLVGMFGNVARSGFDLTGIFEAIGAFVGLVDGKSEVRVRYCGNVSHDVERAAQGAGVEHLLDDRGSLPRTDALRAMRDCSVLVYPTFPKVKDPGLRYQSGAPHGKIFDYMALQRPIVAYPGDGGHAEDLARQTSGAVAGTTAQLTDLFESVHRRWMDDPRSLVVDAAGVAGLSRRTGAEALSRILNRIVGIPDGPTTR